MPHDDQKISRSGWRLLLKGNVIWLGVVSLINDTASEMIFPLLPFFLVQVLGASETFLGLVEGIADSTASLVKLGGGWISDRFQRRKLLVGIGYGLAAVARPLIAVAFLPWHVLVVRFSDRVGKGIRAAPRDALLADSAPDNYRATAFGIHRAADHAGAVLGPLLATVLLIILGQRLRVLFALAAIPGLLTVLVIILKVREVIPSSDSENSARLLNDSVTGRHSGGESERLRPVGSLGPRFLCYIGVIAIFTLGNASDAFLLLRARQLGVALTLVPLLWGVHHIAKMLWAVPGGVLADRFGPRRAITAGWLIYGAVYAGFAFASQPWHIWALFVVYGSFYGLTESPEKALVASLTPQSIRGFAFGTYHFAVGIGALPASLLFGALWQAFGVGVAFLTGAGFALLAVLLLPAALGRAQT